MCQDDGSIVKDFLKELRDFRSGEAPRTGCGKDGPLRPGQDKPRGSLSSMAGSSKADLLVAGHFAAPPAPCMSSTVASGISAVVSSVAPRDFSADVEALRKQQESQKLQLDDLDKYVNQATDLARIDLEEAISKCEVVQSQTTAHDARIGALEGLVRDLTTRLDASQAKVDLLEGQNLDSRLTACEALGSRVDSLETRVEECEKLGTLVDVCDKLETRVEECEKLGPRVEACDQKGIQLEKEMAKVRQDCDISCEALAVTFVSWSDQLRAEVEDKFKKVEGYTEDLKQSFEDIRQETGLYSTKINDCVSGVQQNTDKMLATLGKYLKEVFDLHVDLLKRPVLGATPADDQAKVDALGALFTNKVPCVTITIPAPPQIAAPATPPALSLACAAPSVPTSTPPPPPPPAAAAAASTAASGPTGAGLAGGDPAAAGVSPGGAPAAAGGPPGGDPAAAGGSPAGGSPAATVVPPSTLGELVRSLEKDDAFPIVTGISGVFDAFHLELFGCAYDQDQTEGIMDTISLTPVDFDQEKLTRFLGSFDAERLMPSCLPHPGGPESCEFFLEKLRESKRYKRLDEDEKKVVHQKLWECFLAQFMAFKYDIVADIQARLGSLALP